MGWEEIIQSSTAYLLKTSLSRKNKENASVVNSQTMMDPVENVEKVKK